MTLKNRIEAVLHRKEFDKKENISGTGSTENFRGEK
jgi:hypothetical protein